MMAARDGAAPVLVVDDDAGVRMGLVGLLQAAGYRADGYADAAGALAGADPAAALCALLDIHIGVPDGFALGACLRSVAPSLPILFISGDDDPALAARAARAGALGLLHKPVDADCLLALIDALPAGPGETR
jgi:FixJ family two-component response regulator